MKEQLIDIYETSKRRGDMPDRIIKEDLNINFINQPFVEILGETNDSDYRVVFTNKDNGEVIYDHTMKINHWAKTNKKFFINYQIKVYKDDKPLYVHDYNAKGKRVYVHLDSKSLGDTIAWFPYVEEFRKKHQCEMICSTFWNGFFFANYPMIKFVNPGVSVNNIYAQYTIGINPDDSDKNRNDYREIPLQQVATDMLGLGFFEVRTKISVIPKSIYDNDGRPYVCISKHSTAQAKYWNNSNGWQETVNYLMEQGYDVISVAKEGCDLRGVRIIKDKPISEVAGILQGCEFFVGLPSGLAWLAWALGRKVVMISGFSKPWYEFTENNYYVHNSDPDLCTGCFVDETKDFDKGDWNWCPYHKNTPRQFECTKKITSQMAIEKINEIIENKKPEIDMGILGKKDFDLLKDEMVLYNKYFSPKENDVIVDLGACIGSYLLYAIKDVNFSKYYCVEPFPKNIKALKNNILQSKKFDKIELVEYAINDDIKDASYPEGSNWTEAIKETTGNDIKINVMKFKEFLDKFNIKHIDILKMDIEGSEYSILSKRENLDIIKDVVINMTGEIHFNPLTDAQKIETIDALLYFGDNYNVVFTSVDGIDITKNITEKNKDSLGYYKQFLFYCVNNRSEIK
jgi:autotransporter strand-loop-strand O-heptosyltransferase